MTEELQHDVQERLALIESMMREGRKTTEYWGWSFALWGAAYLIAIWWSYFAGTGQIAWPVTMIGASIITAVVSSIKTRGKPQTAKSRNLGALWTGTGCALFIYAFSASFSGHGEIHTFAAAIETLLGLAHYISGAMLRWKAQQGIGLVYWVAAVAAFYQTPKAIGITFVVITLVCQVGFGIYLMIREARDKARAGQVLHA